MSDIKNPEAYYKRAEANAKKNEYRSNDNQNKHIAFYDTLPELEQDDGAITQELATRSPENMMLFMDNDRMFKALSVLSPEELRIVYLFAVLRYKHSEIADEYGIDRSTMSHKISRIKRKVKNIFRTTTF